MLERAVAAGVPFAWFAADEVYGQNAKLRAWLEAREISYVMAVPCDEPVTAGRETPARGRAGLPGPPRRVAAAVVRGRLEGAAAV